MNDTHGIRNARRFDDQVIHILPYAVASTQVFNIVASIVLMHQFPHGRLQVRQQVATHDLTPVIWDGMVAAEDRLYVSTKAGEVICLGEAPDFPFYERLYVAQAYWQMDDARQFEEWVRNERLRVLASQRDDGSWRDPNFGDCYATAMNCLFLALPEGLLPIFQR